MNSTVVIGAQRMSSLEKVKEEFLEMGVNVRQASNPLYTNFESLGFPERVQDIVMEFYNNYPIAENIWAEILYMDLEKRLVIYKKFRDGIWEEEKLKGNNVFLVYENYYSPEMSYREICQLEAEKKAICINLKYLEKIFNLKMLNPDLVKLVIYDGSIK